MTSWRTIVAGAQTGSRDDPLRLRRIVLQLSVALIVVVALVAVAGAIVSRHTAEREAVHEAAGLADVLAASVIQPALQDVNASDPSTLPAALDAVVRARVLSSSVVRVKVWTPQGQIAYSDETRLIGRGFVLDN
jgi:type VI protein secretion system component VasK